MHKIVYALLTSVLLVAGAGSTEPDDVTKPIRQSIDAFNTGDMKAAYATFAPRTIAIVDGFAPHTWTGPRAPQQWAAEYDKHAQATGVTEGKVTYGESTRKEIEGSMAYVIMPTVYLYRERRKPL